MRTSENTSSTHSGEVKGKQSKPDAKEPRPLARPAFELLLRACGLLYFASYASTSPAVTWGALGINGARCSATNSPALKVDCSSASLCSKTLPRTMV